MEGCHGDLLGGVSRWVVVLVASPPPFLTVQDTILDSRRAVSFVVRVKIDESENDCVELDVCVSFTQTSHPSGIPRRKSTSSLLEVVLSSHESHHHR